MPFDSHPAECPVVNDEPEVVRVLRRAAERIRQHGHLKFERGLPWEKDGHCVLGALEAVSNQGGCLSDSIYGRILFNHLGLRHDPQYRDKQNPEAWVVADWNNAPERTAEEVIQALEDAATSYLESPAASVRGLKP